MKFFMEPPLLGLLVFVSLANVGFGKDQMSTTASQIRGLLNKAEVIHKRLEGLKFGTTEYSDNKNAALKYYQEAAKLGSAEAYFQIAYWHDTIRTNRIANFREAAIRGHDRGMNEYVESIFYRGEDLTSNLIDIVKVGRSYAKVSGKVYILPKTLKFCLEAGPFDGRAFIEKYKISEKELTWTFYPIWRLAEQAANSDRFGPPDTKLVLNLVCHGSSVPAELGWAVRDLYKLWKSGAPPKYHICDYAASRYGLTFCANRETAEKLHPKFPIPADAKPFVKYKISPGPGETP